MYNGMGFLEHVEPDEMFDFFKMLFTKKREKEKRMLYPVAFNYMMSGQLKYETFEDWLTEKSVKVEEKSKEDILDIVRRIADTAR